MNLDKKVQEAAFPGCCYVCGGRIYVGDMIVISKVCDTSVAAHLECQAKLEDLEGGN